jgi:hypothetical protein
LLLGVPHIQSGESQPNTESRSDNPVAHEPMFVSSVDSMARLARAFNGSRPTGAGDLRPDVR